MAILWERNIDGNYYEVRSAGASLRLYRNGVHHSQWNPNRPLNGSIWDLFVLPALHRPSQTFDDVLILGFGAGAVARLLREMVEPGRIVGVELDEVHLSIADGFFECSEGCELICGDAVEWVQDQAAAEESFDLIIDDLYSEEDEVPQRCAPLDDDWFVALVKLLKPNGVLVLNILEPEKVLHLPPNRQPELRERLPHSISYRIEGYENRLVAFSHQPFDENFFAERLKEILKMYPSCRGVGKRYLFENK
ncbi:MAG: class I SAM-dependent methyltransferase [Verrucomicrobiota bacterium]